MLQKLTAAGRFSDECALAGTANATTLQRPHTWRVCKWGSIKKRDMQGLMRVGIHAKSQRSVRGLRSGGATKRNTLENNRDMSPTPNVPLLPPSTGSNTEHESPFYLGSGLGCTTQCRLDEEKQTLAQLVTRRCIPGGGTGPHEAVLTHFDLLNCYAALSLCEIL